MDNIPLADWNTCFSGKDGRAKKRSFFEAHALLVPILTFAPEEDVCVLTRKTMAYSLGQFIHDVYVGNASCSGEVFFFLLLFSFT
jgi:hypothetical protein